MLVIFPLGLAGPQEFINAKINCVRHEIINECKDKLCKTCLTYECKIHDMTYECKENLCKHMR